MSCQNQSCKSERILRVNGKVSDMGSYRIGDHQLHDYAPRDMGIGGGDYIKFEVCLQCGQAQGAFPVPPTALERGEKEEE